MQTWIRKINKAFTRYIYLVENKLFYTELYNNWDNISSFCVYVLVGVADVDCHMLIILCVFKPSGPWLYLARVVSNGALQEKVASPFIIFGSLFVAFTPRL